MHRHIARQERVVADDADAFAHAVLDAGKAGEPALQVNAGGDQTRSHTQKNQSPHYDVPYNSYALLYRGPDHLDA